MRINKAAVSAALLALALAAAMTGCGKKAEKDQDSAEKFRVPDSLLTPIEGYRITIDEYHPVNGGVMANKDIELHYPPSNIARFIVTTNFGVAFNARKKVEQEIGRPFPGRIVIIGAKDLDEYRFLTRKEWWYYGVMQGDTLYCAPFDVMMKRFDVTSQRPISEIALTQKIAQMALRNMSGDKLPLWMREAVASWIAGEKSILEVQAIEWGKELVGFNPPVEELEGHLREASDRGATRVSFFISYKMLENLLESHPMSEIMAFAGRLGEGAELDEASKESFGMDYGTLIETVRMKGEFMDYLGDALRDNSSLRGGN